ncbi:MAG: cyclin-dependent kinase inhibitor 3 family protein [Formivibrio sp.]|nr:cyclin-dependent kinase inhibitor 3 family protein [Formivibrio sp.]
MSQIDTPKPQPLRAVTSEESPLRIASVPASCGLIGMTICPGKHSTTSLGGFGWERNLAIDVSVIRDWGATMVVTLMEDWELSEYRVPTIGDVVRDAGMKWFHLPIIDGRAPDEGWEIAWKTEGKLLRTELLRGGSILIHCLGGRGRTGTVAAQLLIELGETVDDAIERIRSARDGMIETEEQEQYLRSLPRALRP